VKFKNEKFAHFDGIGSKLIIRGVDYVSDVYFIPNPLLGGPLGHSRYWREIQNLTFLAIFALGIQIG